MAEDRVTHIRNVSNPAAFGAEWEADGTTFQLVNSRHTTSLMFSMKRADGAGWTFPHPVVRPERFGMNGILTSPAQFLAVARAFVDAGPTTDTDVSPPAGHGG
jgi:hypothetical protein